MNKKFFLRAAMSLGLLALVTTIALFIVNYDKQEKKNVDLSLEMSSEIVSTDPKISASNFIKYNGTMGDVSQLSQEHFASYQTETNSDRRMSAYSKVKDAIVNDSPLLSERIEQTIKGQTSEFPVYYTIKELKVSEPTSPVPLIINHNNEGPVEYESVEVYVDFTSYQDVLYWPTDVSGESIITQMEASDSFENVKVTLIKSGDLWFIYDVEDSEYLLNVRMSTWHGRGQDDVSTEQKLVNEYTMDYNLSNELEEVEND